MLLLARCFKYESNTSHFLNQWKLVISNPWYYETLLHFTSTLISAVVKRHWEYTQGIQQAIWGLGFHSESVFTSKSGRLLWSIHFPISQDNWGAIYLMLIEASGLKW